MTFILVIILIVLSVLIALSLYFLLTIIYLRLNGYCIVFYNADNNFYDLEELEKPLLVKKKVLEQRKEENIFNFEYIELNIKSFFLFVYYNELENAFYDYYNSHYIEY